ncbi:MAG: hypothetical protein SPH44_12150 [Eubacteriales bacterium]|nr:hypothetical protein [Eubacteriales bacterium]
MLENLYTTKMSANKKTLQNRFTKIRRKSGRISKIMAAVMSCAVAITMLGATIVMAAVGSDGLEHWDKNEIYYKDGVKFSVNVSGKNVPAWVYEDVAGEDGKINVTVNRYQTRDLKGNVNNDHLVELLGEKGKIKLASQSSSMAYKHYDGAVIPDYLRQYPCYSEINFIEFNNVGYAPESKVITALTDKKESKYRRIEVYFAFNDKKEMQTVFLNLGIADKNDNPENMSFDGLQPVDGLTYIGNFLEDYTNDVWNDDTANYYFTMYEDNYQNKKADGIDFNIGKAAAEGIVLNSSVTLPQAEHIVIYVYDKNNRNVSIVIEKDKNTQTEQFVLTPKKMLIYDLSFEQESKYEEDIPENQFVSGEKYRVCCVVLDKDRNVIYRWHEYVTIQ